MSATILTFLLAVMVSWPTEATVTSVWARLRMSIMQQASISSEPSAIGTRAVVAMSKSSGKWLNLQSYFDIFSQFRQMSSKRATKVRTERPADRQDDLERPLGGTKVKS